MSQQSFQSHVSIAETATILGSEPQSIPTFSQESREDTILSPPSPTTEEECDILSLAERLPDIKDVIAGLKPHHRITAILTTPNVLTTDELHQWFIDVYFHHEPDNDDDFWSEAWYYMYESISDNTPTKQNQVKSCKDGYITDIQYMITHHFSTRQFPPYPGVVPDDFAVKLQCLSQVIGWAFVDFFESLISPPRGKMVVPLQIQLDECLKELESKDLNEYFDKGLDKHVMLVRMRLPREILLLGCYF
jgi:hypothetical protein